MHGTVHRGTIAQLPTHTCSALWPLPTISSGWYSVNAEIGGKRGSEGREGWWRMGKRGGGGIYGRKGALLLGPRRVDAPGGCLHPYFKEGGRQALIHMMLYSS